MGLIDRPDRLIYLSSGLHHAAAGSLRDIDWTSRPWNAAQAYAESKLYVTALGGYWYHRQRQAPAAQARDLAFQYQLRNRLAALTGVALF
jgi:hypothetical protein